MTDTNSGVDWPVKTREVEHNHFDSTIWNDFEFRDDDIIIGTYAKSGTTWLQQIVSQLIFQGETGLPVAEMSPWLDFRLAPIDEVMAGVAAQTHRRFIKTHLPLDALVYSREAKYIYIARDGRDVMWSYYNHHANHSDFFYEMAQANTPPHLEPHKPPTQDIVEYFRTWLEKDGYPLWSYWENIETWWRYRHAPNLLLLHFSNLKRDMPGEIRRIAEFLDIEIDETRWPAILEHCSFDYMKANAGKSVPLGGIPWKGGAETFIHKGVNGRWRDRLTADDIARYETMAVERLGEACASWLATGEGADA